MPCASSCKPTIIPPPYTPPVTLLCIPIMVADPHAALAAATHARTAGADLVEYRLDHVFHDAPDIPLIQRLITDSPLPCIVTCRHASEGGAYDGDDDARIALYEHLGNPATGDHPPRYIDVEQSTLGRSANIRQKILLAIEHPAQRRDLATGLILSHHDFTGRPANLFSILTAMRAEHAAAIHKVAFAARSLRDNLEVFDILAHRDRPTIALAMGEAGLMSRILAPKFGGFLTFASLHDTSATAPGQPTIHDLLHLYRFRSINPATRTYGVVGWPVAHSLSPAVHNAGFEAVNHDGVYLPLPIPPEWEHFKATILALLDFAPLTLRGLSITLPHKEHLLRLAREDDSRPWTIDPIAARIGAANTLTIADNGACAITNTDALGALVPLRATLGRDIAGLRAIILGAGGAARAVAAALLDAGAAVHIAARTHQRAADLAANLGPGPVAALPAAELARTPCEVVVNCTPVGMAGGRDPDALPIDNRTLHAWVAGPRPLVMETVYNPLQTPLLAAAARLGLPILPGLDMFIHQAAAQFHLWTGRTPPTAPFRRICEETLATPTPPPLKDI